MIGRDSRALPVGRRVPAASAAVIVLALLVGGGCGAPDSDRRVVVQGADDVQVMTPDEVAEQRMPTLTTAPTTPGEPLDPSASAAPPSSDQGTAAETIPLVQDDRPPELKLFDAYAEFTSCLADDGYEVEGNLQDPNNPAYQDADYLEAVRTCAARSDIVNVLQEVQSTRSNLTPEEVEQRNEAFVALRDCLVDKGWTIETTTDENGLLNPVVFQDPDGELDSRDIDQCLSDAGIG